MSMLADDKHPPMAPRPVPRSGADAGRPRRQLIPPMRPLAAEADPVSQADALDALRNIVVGPAMQLNESRLAELVAIMEEREAELRNDLAETEARMNAAREALEARIQTMDEQFAARLESAVHALADAAAKQHAELKAEIRDGLANAAQQNRALAGHLDYAAQRLESQIEERVAALNADLIDRAETLNNRIVENRKSVMAELGRAIGGLASAVGSASEDATDPA